MVLKLPKSVLESLPSPDSKGLVRVSIALRLDDGGKARVSEINDVPTDPADNGEEEADPADSDSASPDLDEVAGEMPSPDDVASQILSP